MFKAFFCQMLPPSSTATQPQQIIKTYLDVPGPNVHERAIMQQLDDGVESYNMSSSDDVALKAKTHSF